MKVRSSSVRLWPRSLPGFALLDATLALGLLGVIAASSLSFLHTQRVAAKAEKTRKALETAIQSLVAYAQAFSRLPRPSETAEGFESERSSLLVGLIPYRTLCLDGSSVKDGRGHLLTYAVTPELTNLLVSSPLELLAPEDEPRGLAAVTNRGALQIIDTKGQKVCPSEKPEADFCAFFVVSPASDEQLTHALQLHSDSLICRCPPGPSSFRLRWLSRNHLLRLMKEK